LAQAFAGQKARWFVGFYAGKNVATQGGSGGKQPESGAKSLEPGGVAGLFAANFGLLQARLARVGQSLNREFRAARKGS